MNWIKKLTAFFVTFWWLIGFIVLSYINAYEWISTGNQPQPFLLLCWAYCLNFALYSLFNRGQLVLSKPLPLGSNSLQSTNLAQLQYWTSQIRFIVLLIAFALLSLQAFSSYTVTEIIYTLTIMIVTIDSALFLYRAAKKQLIT